MRLGEFIGAKVDAKIADWNEWLAVPDNEENAFFVATLGSAALAAGIEIAADIVGRREEPRAKLKSAGLHVLAAATATETLLSAMVFGSASGQNKIKKKHRIRG